MNVEYDEQRHSLTIKRGDTSLEQFVSEVNAILPSYPNLRELSIYGWDSEFEGMTSGIDFSLLDSRTLENLELHGVQVDAKTLQNVNQKRFDSEQERLAKLGLMLLQGGDIKLALHDCVIDGEIEDIHTLLGNRGYVFFTNSIAPKIIEALQQQC